MPTPDIHSTLHEWLAFRPGLSHVFTEHRLDLCRDSDKPLDEVCREQRVDPRILIAELNRTTRPSHCELGADWATAPLGELCRHLEEIHHAFYLRELPRLAALSSKVAAAYSASHPETAELDEAFRRFRAALESHLEREQRELFPAIRRLVELRPPAEPPDIAGLLNSLERDHDAVDEQLLRIRELTHGFTAPPEVCQTFQSLLDGLWELEMNLHQNVHEENQFLFPRAARHKAALSAARKRKLHGG
ncbi:MAG TPA: hemerythrin domain-containing protein [Pirellulales bacterium]|nr:hemerythrin domain-containing protein [Pirellulales bacterium]